MDANWAVGWLFRIAITLLIFIVIYVGVPWLVGFVGLVIPDLLMKAVAALIALGWLFQSYWLPRTRGPVV